MSELWPVLLGLLLAASSARAMPPIAAEPTARLELTSAADGAPLPLPFFVKLGDAWVEGRVEFDHATETVQLSGVYTTAQGLDPLARLSYQIYSDDGRLLVQDGARFDWQAGEADGERTASFAIAQSMKGRPGLRPGFRLQFNYVVENEYWHRDRFPEVALPQLAIRGPERAAYFRLLWSGVPPFWPAGADGRIPALIRAEFGASHDYKPALEIEAADGKERYEAPRGDVSTTGAATKLVWYRVGNQVTESRVRVRPGFVWDGVEWYQWPDPNPPRDMRVVGALGYLAVLTAIMWGLATAAGWLRARRARWARVAGWGVWSIGVASVLRLAMGNGYLLLALAPLGFRYLRSWTASPGHRAYWTVWLFGALSEFYWAHVDAATTATWRGTVLSLSLLALLLLPLRLFRRRNSAALAGMAAIGLTAVVSTALAVYFDFFHDYPGLRDLMYAGQIGEVGDSLWALIGQRHLVPWWLAAWACWPLWTTKRREPDPVSDVRRAGTGRSVSTAASRVQLEG